jgi:ankyrin repeat protein
VYVSLDSDIGENMGHAQGFFSCNNTQFFYDDNGVSDLKNNTHQEFNWREYLKRKLINIKKDLEKNLEIDKTYFKDLYTLVGKDYLRSENYYPLKFSLIFYERLTKEEYEIKNISNLCHLGRFTNKRVKDLILNYIKLNPTKILTNKIINDIISTYNYILLDLFLKLNESDNLKIDYEKINLVFNVIYLTINKKESKGVFDKNLIDVLINNNINFNVLTDNHLLLNELLNFFTDDSLDIYEYILKSNKIDINTDEKFSSPVLFHTIQNINHENKIVFMKIIKLLLKYGANPNISHGKVNLIIYCTRKKLYSILSVLLKNGGNVNIQEDISRNTPLHIAVINKNRKIIELLLENGADISMINSKNKTPLDIAIENNYQEGIILLQ